MKSYLENFVIFLPIICPINYYLKNINLYMLQKRLKIRVSKGICEGKLNYSPLTQLACSAKLKSFVKNVFTKLNKKLTKVKTLLYR